MRAGIQRNLITAAFAALLCGCGAAGEESVPPVPAPTVTAEVFDVAVLHYAEIEVAEEHVGALVPFSDEYAPARLVYDGTAVEEVGVRLKGHSSAQGLDGKPGFSVKTNAFVKGRTLNGVKKFTLNNGVQDSSGLHEHVAYEVWRRAGVAAHRTALARVTFNGTFYGVYTTSEAYDGAFLKSNFGDDSGNLYEGAPGVDLVDVDALELQTNEEENDRSDASALAETLLSCPDAELEDELEPLVDLEAFLSYWAVEAIVNHWDGYAAQRTDGLGEPNNYYVYCVPADRRFVFLPHGADQTLRGLEDPVTVLPAEGSRLARRLAEWGPTRERYRGHVREVLDSAWDAPALLARVDAAYALVAGSVLEESARRPGAFDSFAMGVAELRDFLRRRRAAVLAELDGAEPQ